jgi:hypothetical protein
MKPGEYMPGKFQDMGKEIIATDASGPIGSRVFATNATDETLLMYAYHPDHGIRSGVASAITKNGRTHLILPLLKSKDPRGRGVGVLTLAGMFKGAPIPVESMTDEMYGILAEMITDPEESRWVAFHAMTALARGPAEKIIPLTDRLLYFLKQDDWWIQTAALKPLAKIATDERVYQKVLPAVGDMAAKNTAACGLGNIRDVAVALASAKPEIKELGLAVFAKAYAAIPDRLVAPGGADLAIGSRMFKGALSGCINAFLEGADLMLRMPKMTSAWSASRKESDKYIYNGTFAPNKALVGKWQTVGVAKSAEDYQAQLAKEAEEEAKAKEAAAKQNKPAPPPKPKAQPRFGIGALDLQDGGKIGGAKGMVWSGIMLINGGSEEALKMEVKSVQGKEYLLVETGGFNQVDTTKEEQPKWNPNYYVMERVK